MSDLQKWWDEASANFCFRVIDDSLPASTQPLKIMLTPHGDITVYPKNQLQLSSGTWSTNQRSAIKLKFPVMVAGQPNITVEHHVALLRNTDLYASSTVGVSFMLTPWKPLTAGTCFEDLQALTPELRTCPRPLARERYIESGGSSDNPAE